MFFGVSGYVTWLEDNCCEKKLYDKLVNIVGKELDIRLRQRLFVLKDLTRKVLNSDMVEISSGSLSEGLDLPGSDIDVMFVIAKIAVVPYKHSLKYPIKSTTLLMETVPFHPGFARLKLVAECYQKFDFFIRHSFIETHEGLYLVPYTFLNKIRLMCLSFDFTLHGPCLSDREKDVDMAFCLRCKSWPFVARNWIHRHRKQWPPTEVIDAVINYGCLLVPIGPKALTITQLFWRISFSVAEKKLVHSFNYTQLLCYGLLKLTLKRIIKNSPTVEDVLCSYFLKTTLFWISEEVSIELFQLDNLFCCFSLCLDKLSSFIKNCYCPNYFIPEHNMFLGRINNSNNKTLISVLNRLICGGSAGLVSYLFNDVVCVHVPPSSLKTNYFNQLDFMVYKSFSQLGMHKNINSCYLTNVVVNTLLQSESSAYIRDVFKLWTSALSQNIVQLLSSPVKIQNVDNIRSRYHKHLQRGLHRDAVSGWLLYSSFYYVIGEYHDTLRITDYVLSKCTPDKIYLGSATYDQVIMNKYAQSFYAKEIRLHEKARLATISFVAYLRHSSLIPEELQMYVNSDSISVPPVVLSHCLRFLCYHHLGKIVNRQQALQNLYLTIKEKYFIFPHEIPESLIILGICYKLSGDINSAYQCFNNWLQRYDYIGRILKTERIKNYLCDGQ